jgi:hypothetical protein
MHTGKTRRMIKTFDSDNNIVCQTTRKCMKTNPSDDRASGKTCAHHTVGAAPVLPAKPLGICWRHATLRVPPLHVRPCLHLLFTRAHTGAMGTMVEGSTHISGCTILTVRTFSTLQSGWRGKAAGPAHSQLPSMSLPPNKRKTMNCMDGALMGG